jgi:hypothetical protein
MRGRNPTRDSQVDGAPMVHEAPVLLAGASSFLVRLVPIGHRSHAF